VPERLRPQPVSPSLSNAPVLVCPDFSFGIDILFNRCLFQRPPDDTEIQELRVKVRVLEAKRTDDARHIRELESQIEDAKNFIAVKPKLQLKLNQLQQDLITTRRDLADSQQLCQLAEGRVVDAQDQLEMAMLDKEMAEERSEAAQAELGEVQEKLAVLQVEMNVIKGGDESGGITVCLIIFFPCLIPWVLENSIADGEPSAKGSFAYLQLEKQNERLKEALIKQVGLCPTSFLNLTREQAA
jgi:dynactin 1